MEPAGRTLLHVTQPTDAGVARCVLDDVTAQVRAGHEVHVACPVRGDLAEQVTAAGATVHPWPAQRAPGPTTVAETLRLRRLVAAVQPDLIHLHAAKAGLAGRLAVRGRVPTVFQPHAWSFDAVTGPMRLASLRWERAATRWTDVLICVSAAERDRGAAAGVTVGRTALVPNGVDLQTLRPADADARLAARRRLGLDEAARLCVCVGRLTRQKGQDVLLRAWPDVAAAVPTARLVLVGGGPAESDLRTASPPDVLFAGVRSDIRDWLAAADVVAAPSRWEGMALVPLEAMAVARSVVVSDATGMRECVPAGGGAVVPIEATAALSEALIARLGGSVDPDAEGRIGRRAMEEHHDLQNTVAAVMAAYSFAVRP